MRMTRIFLAAAAAAMLSTSASLATPPSASQVSVPQSAEISRREAKMQALFSSPEEMMMFRMQMREATKGMDRAHKKAYRHQEMKRIRAMNDSEKASFRRDLDSRWSALPADRRTRMAQKMERHEAKREAHAEQRHGNQNMNQAPQQQ